MEAGLARAALSALGLARRTGDVAVGFEKVRAGLKEKKFAALISGRDGAEDGKRKLEAQAGDVVRIGLFSIAELSAALGMENAVHAGIKYGAGAERFLRAARRLEGFRPA